MACSGSLRAPAEAERLADNLRIINGKNYNKYSILDFSDD
jgi:hypothetical protein